LATSTEGSGHAGQLQVHAGNIEVQSEGEISVSSTGTGDAGSMAIEANQIHLNRGGRLRADSMAGLGNIDLQTDNLVLQGNSQISTNSTGLQPGGNITIATDTLASLENSDITANAIAGDGGNIQITTSGLLLSANSQITASSQFGLDGRVAVNSPDVNPEAGLLQVENDLKQQTQIVATACQRIEGSEFVVTGYGGMPPKPQETLNQFSTWMDWRSPQSSPVTSATSSTDHSEFAPDSQIQEARGWKRRPDGTVELVASKKAQQGWSPSVNCQQHRSYGYSGQGQESQ
jgi:large exoprotein involved in heme utilization and adhesion